MVEDESSMRRIVCQGLTEANHTVTAARDGAEALAALDTTAFDAVLLDLMLPGVSGLDVLRRMRQRRNHVPVLILTARDSTADVVAGLDAGADDYLVKPFAFDVLLARLRAISRRAVAPPVAHLTVADLVVTPATRAVERGGRPIVLTATEFRLLEFLMQSPGRVFSREQMLDSVWGHDVYIDERTVDVHIGRLRKVLNRPRQPDPIRTVRGAGYSFDETFARG